jgi:DNA topoisomerase-1
MGRYGPFVQIGTREDVEKPRFAGLRPGQKMDEITLDEALALFKLPRHLGETANGLPVQASIGRFGPYVKYGDKFISLKGDDPYTINLERALELIEQKQQLDANRVIREFNGSDIRVLNGRYGPYVTDGANNARIPKDKEPTKLSLAECRQLIEQASTKKSRRRPAPKRSASG